MKTEKKVSVVITAHNRKKYLKDAIESILHQDVDHDVSIEIIVVSNFDDPDLTRFMKEKSIINVRTDKDSFGEKLAAGIDLSNGDIICFLDDDDMFHRKKISKVLEIFENNPGMSYLHNDIQTISEDTTFNEKMGESISNNRNGLDVFNLSENKPSVKSGKLTSKRADWYVSCISIRSELAKKYSSILKKIYRSLDKALFLAAVDYGHEIGTTQNKLTLYRKHESVTGIKTSREKFMLAKHQFTMESMENLEFLSSTLSSSNENYRNFHRVFIKKMQANDIIYSMKRKSSIHFALKMISLFIGQGCRECFFIAGILFIHFLSPGRSIDIYMKIQNSGI